MLTLVFLPISLSLTSCSPTGTSEADRIIKQYWDKTVAKCGDNYITDRPYMSGTTVVPGERLITAFKGFSYSVQSYPVTEADKLNSIEWHGRTNFYSTSYRYWIPNVKTGGTWWHWSEGTPADYSYIDLIVELEKEKGHWFYAQGGGAFVFKWNDLDKYNPEPIVCKNIPPM
jgi:hypothetical protein